MTTPGDDDKSETRVARDALCLSWTHHTEVDYIRVYRHITILSQLEMSVLVTNPQQEEEEHSPRALKQPREILGHI